MVLADSDGIPPVPPYSGYCSFRFVFVQGYHLLWRCFPYNFRFHASVLNAVLQPRNRRDDYGLGFSPFARHYLGNHYCSLFLRVLRCFSSPGLLLFRDLMSSTSGLPHSDITWIRACLQLPMAFRSLPRPSSPANA